MTRVRFGKRVPVVEEGGQELADHREDYCRCTGADRYIVRVYFGYGLCGFCGKLTGWKVRGWRVVG